MGRDLHLPATGPAHSAAVVLHPHPSMGGDRRHPFVVAVAEGLAGHGVAGLRVDLTDPDPEASAAALEDLAADLVAEVGVERLLLVGYSWGAAVTARVAHPQLAARVLVAPPASMLANALDATPGDGPPTLILVPVDDQYGPPHAVLAAVGDRSGTTLEVIHGADHFLVGAVARIADRTVGWLTTV